MKKILRYLFVLFLCVCEGGCTWDYFLSDEGFYAARGYYRHTFIFCALGYNNLSSYLSNNLEEMKSSWIPVLNRDVAVVAFCHNTVNNRINYSTPNPPVLIRLYRENGVVVSDTLKVYPEETISADVEIIRGMLLDVQELVPSESYGMLFSSHATGWMPWGYTKSSEYGTTASSTSLSTSSLFYYPVEEGDYPLTKTVGAHYLNSSSNSYEMDVIDFAAAIPYHLDYIIFDACLMGCVEVAWELKDVCSKIVFSPTEVIATGFVYKTMIENLLSGKDPDLEAVCREYYEYYNQLSGSYRSATVTLVDCSKLDRLAEVFSSIVEMYGDELPNISRSSVQRYFRNASGVYFYFYYDLGSLAKAMCSDEALLEELENALAECVLYHAETPSFLNSFDLDDCCGMSVYFPSESWPELNSYYRSLGWNENTGLVASGS